MNRPPPFPFASKRHRGGGREIEEYRPRKRGDRETLLPAIKNKVGHSPRKVKYCLDGKRVSFTFGKCWIPSAPGKKEGERTLFSPWLSCPGQMIYRVVISRCRKLRLSGRPVMDGRRDGRRTDGRTDVGVRSEKEEEGASPKKRRSPRLEERTIAALAQPLLLRQFFPLSTLLLPKKARSPLGLQKLPLGSSMAARRTKGGRGCHKHSSLFSSFPPFTHSLCDDGSATKME